MRTILLAFAIVLSAAPAAAMVVCENDECEITERGTTRKMSPKEVDRHVRKGNLQTVEQIRCAHSDDAEKCEAALTALRKLFVY